MLGRALLAAAALPGLVAFVIPLLLAWHDVQEASFRPVALVLLIPGLALLVWSIRAFLVVGRGTLAPWDPPRRLLTGGPYHASRNPMYIAIVLVLAGWALAFRSWILLAYTAAVAAGFHARVILAEEPWLARVYRDEWRRYAARVPRWIFPSRRALLTSAAVGVIALPIAGLIYEAYADARDARRFPPPGTLVDIGGRRLHLLCIGDGTPVVLFEAGEWGSAAGSAAARERLARRTTVCSYDRRGQGWSDPGPGAASAAALALDLAVLQDRAQLGGPMILVAASIGGLTAEMFARQYPERVAGLVLLDAASSFSLPPLAAEGGRMTTIACTGAVLAHLGVVRLLDPFGLAGGDEDAQRSAALVYNARTWDGACAMARGLEASLTEFESAPPLEADLPLVALGASSAEGLLPDALARFANVERLHNESLKAQQHLAGAAGGTWQLVPDSTHLIGESQPDAVVEAVFALMDEIR